MLYSPLNVIVCDIEDSRMGKSIACWYTRCYKDENALAGIYAVVDNEFILALNKCSSENTH